ncbi:MAG: 50S ribosomal protein L22 [Verrucomicrobia bacterium]|jgi:large subunit ribosomal protein L22|nr:50S ribosomal protein L22 [Verrucomicrobiota bacterium]
MDVLAITKRARMSPTKARDLAREIQGKPVAEALRITTISERKAAFQLGKTLKSAIANAESNADLAVDDLRVKEAVIDEGPRMKRYWPRARGMVRHIVKKTCHIKIVLTDDK